VRKRSRISTRVSGRGEQYIARARVNRGWNWASGVRSFRSCLPNRLMFLTHDARLGIRYRHLTCQGLAFRWNGVCLGLSCMKSRIVHRFYVKSYSTDKDNPARAECLMLGNS
jgi:hypothetical protein